MGTINGINGESMGTESMGSMVGLMGDQWGQVDNALGVIGTGR